MNLREKSICIVENGHHVFFSEEMVASYGKVFLYLMQEDSYLKPDKDTIGSGIPGVNLLEYDEDFWKLVDFDTQNDCVFFFPDVGQGALQRHLQRLGKRVCGSLASEKVEMDRWYLNECLKQVGLPVVPMRKIIGTTALKAFLKKNPNQVVKISYYRGVVETFLADDPWEMELQIIELDHLLGMNKDSLEFVCQDIIESALEIGYDGFNVNGLHPQYSMRGPEFKDKGYIGLITKETPPLLKYVNEKMAPIFAKHKYQGFYSNELRLVDKPWKGFPCTPVYTDATCRTPSPPAEAFLKAYEPHCVARAIWDCSEGRLPLLKPITKWVAEVVLMSPKADHAWLHVTIPDSLRKWVLLKDHCHRKEGGIFIIPNSTGGYFGNVVALSDNPQDAINLVLKRAKEIKACELEVRTDIFDGVPKQLKLMQKYELL